MKDRRLGIGEDLSENVHFVLLDHPNKVRRNQKDDLVEYDMLCLNDMKVMVTVLGDVVKPGAHGHILCSVPKFDL